MRRLAPGDAHPPEQPAPWARGSGSNPLSARETSRVSNAYNINKRLEELRSEARSRQLAVHVPALALGTFAIMVGALVGALALLGVIANPEHRHIGWLFLRLGACVVLVALWPTRGSAWVLVAGSVACAVATPFPRIIRHAQGIAVQLACGASCPGSYPPGCTVCIAAFAGIVQAAGGTALWMAATARLVRALTVRPALSTHTVLARHWFIIGQTLLLQGVLDISMLILSHAFSDFARLYSNGLADAALLFASAGQEALLGALLSMPHVRSAVQAWLAVHSKAVTSAAGIAQLLGARNNVDVLARERFTCVSADMVTIDDFRSNEARPMIAAGRSERAKLGEVDAFVSHSWHDDPQAKWDALQAWRSDFKAQHDGAEPRLWIDKLAIDQTNIQDSLACLPLYLAGCDSLLLLAGDSYLTRLWCIIELFVFVQMGGSEAQIIPLPLAPAHANASHAKPRRLIRNRDGAPALRPSLFGSEHSDTSSARCSACVEAVTEAAAGSTARAAPEPHAPAPSAAGPFEERATVAPLVRAPGSVPVLELPSLPVLHMDSSSELEPQDTPPCSERSVASVPPQPAALHQKWPQEPRGPSCSERLECRRSRASTPSPFSLRRTRASEPGRTSPEPRGSSAYEPELYERLFTSRVECFDVRNAECSVAEDRTRLSAVIEAGFINAENFNRVISGTLMRSLALASEARRRAKAARSSPANAGRTPASAQPAQAAGSPQASPWVGRRRVCTSNSSAMTFADASGKGLGGKQSPRGPGSGGTRRWRSPDVSVQASGSASSVPMTASCIGSIGSISSLGQLSCSGTIAGRSATIHPAPLADKAMQAMDEVQRYNDEQSIDSAAPAATVLVMEEP